MMNCRFKKHKNWIRLVISLIVIAFLTQNVAWAEGSGMLMPDNKGIMAGLRESLEKAPGLSGVWTAFNTHRGLTEDEKRALEEFIVKNKDTLPASALSIFLNLLGVNPLLEQQENLIKQIESKMAAEHYPDELIRKYQEAVRNWEESLKKAHIKDTRKNFKIIVNTYNDSQSLNNLLESIYKELVTFEYGKGVEVIVLEHSTETGEIKNNRNSIKKWNQKLAETGRDGWNIRYVSLQDQFYLLKQIQDITQTDAEKAFLYMREDAKKPEDLADLGFSASMNMSLLWLQAKKVYEEKNTLVMFFDQDVQIGALLKGEKGLRTRKIAHTFDYISKAFNNPDVSMLSCNLNGDSANAMDGFMEEMDVLEKMVKKCNSLDEVFPDTELLPDKSRIKGNTYRDVIRLLLQEIQKGSYSAFKVLQDNTQIGTDTLQNIELSPFGTGFVIKPEMAGAMPFFDVPRGSDSLWELFMRYFYGNLYMIHTPVIHTRYLKTSRDIKSELERIRNSGITAQGTRDWLGRMGTSHYIVKNKLNALLLPNQQQININAQLDISNVDSTARSFVIKMQRASEKVSNIIRILTEKGLADESELNLLKGLNAVLDKLGSMDIGEYVTDVAWDFVSYENKWPNKIKEWQRIMEKVKKYKSISEPAKNMAEEGLDEEEDIHGALSEAFDKGAVCAVYYKDMLFLEKNNWSIDNTSLENLLSENIIGKKDKAHAMKYLRRYLSDNNRKENLLKDLQFLYDTINKSDHSSRLRGYRFVLILEGERLFSQYHILEHAGSLIKTAREKLPSASENLPSIYMHINIVDFARGIDKKAPGFAFTDEEKYLKSLQAGFPAILEHADFHLKGNPNPGYFSYSEDNHPYESREQYDDIWRFWAALAPKSAENRLKRYGFAPVDPVSIYPKVVSFDWGGVLDLYKDEDQRENMDKLLQKLKDNNIEIIVITRGSKDMVWNSIKNMGLNTYIKNENVFGVVNGSKGSVLQSLQKEKRLSFNEIVHFDNSEYEINKIKNGVFVVTVGVTGKNDEDTDKMIQERPNFVTDGFKNIDPIIDMLNLGEKHSKEERFISTFFSNNGRDTAFNWIIEYLNSLDQRKSFEFVNQLILEFKRRGSRIYYRKKIRQIILYLINTYFGFVNTNIYSEALKRIKVVYDIEILPKTPQMISNDIKSFHHRQYNLSINDANRVFNGQIRVFINKLVRNNKKKLKGISFTAGIVETILKSDKAVDYSLIDIMYRIDEKLNVGDSLNGVFAYDSAVITQHIEDMRLEMASPDLSAFKTGRIADALAKALANIILASLPNNKELKKNSIQIKHIFRNAAEDWFSHPEKKWQEVRISIIKSIDIKYNNNYAFIMPFATVSNMFIGMFAFLSILAFQNNPHIVYTGEIIDYIKMKYGWILERMRQAIDTPVMKFFIWWVFIVGLLFISGIFPSASMPFGIGAPLMMGILGSYDNANGYLENMIRLFDSGKYTELIRMKDNALKVVGENTMGRFQVYNIVGTAYNAIGDFENAILEFEKAVKVSNFLGNKQKTSASVNLGRVYSLAGRYQDAINILEPLLLIYTGDLPNELREDVIFRLGISYFSLKKFDAAERNLAQIRNSDYAAIVDGTLALIYMMRGKNYKKALEYLDSADNKADAKNDAVTKCMINFQRWRIYLLMEDKDRADSYFERGLKYPSGIIEKNTMELSRLLMFISEGKLSRFEKYIKKMADKDRLFALKFFRFLLKNNVIKVDLRNFRETMTKIFGFKSSVEYINWILGIGSSAVINTKKDNNKKMKMKKKVKAKNKIKGSKKHTSINEEWILLAVKETIYSLRQEGNADELQKLQNIAKIKGTAAIMSAFTGGIPDIKIEKQKSIQKSSLMLLLNDMLEAFRSKNIEKAYKKAIKAAEDLQKVDFIIPAEMISALIAVLYEGLLKDKSYTERIFIMRNMIKYLEDKGYSKELIAKAKYYLGNIYNNSIKETNEGNQYLTEAFELSRDPDLKATAAYNIGVTCYVGVVHLENPDKKSELAKEGLEWFKQSLAYKEVNPRVYIFIAYLYGEIGENINAFKILAKAKKKKEDLRKEGIDIDELAEDSIRTILSSSVTESDMKRLLIYILKENALGLAEMALKNRKGILWYKWNRKRWIERILDILQDDILDIKTKRKAVNFLKGINLTQYSERILALLREELKSYKLHKNKSLFVQEVELLQGCYSNNAIDFLDSCLKEGKVIKKTKLKSAIEGIRLHISEILNEINEAKSSGEFYIGQDAVNELLNSDVILEKLEIGRYIREKETASIKARYRYIPIEEILERSAEGHKRGLNWQEFKKIMEGINSGYRRSYFRISDNLKRIERYIEEKKWDDASRLTVLAIQGNIEQMSPGAEWVLANISNGKKEKIRKELGMLWYSWERGAALKDDYKKLDSIVQKWRSNLSGLNVNTEGIKNTLDISKAFYYMGYLNEALTIMRKIPLKKIKENEYAVLWFIKILYRNGNIKEAGDIITSVKETASPWLNFNIGKCLREFGYPLRAKEEFLSYFHSHNIDNKGLYMDNFAVLVNLLESLTELNSALAVFNEFLGSDTAGAYPVKQIFLEIIAFSNLMNSIGLYTDNIDFLERIQVFAENNKEKRGVLIQKAVTCYKMDNIKDAEALYRKALEISSEKQRLHIENNLVPIYVYNRNFAGFRDAAVKAWNAGFKVTPADTVKQLLRASIKGEKDAIEFIGEILSSGNSVLIDIFKTALSVFLSQYPEDKDNLLSFLLNILFSEKSVREILLLGDRVEIRGGTMLVMAGNKSIELSDNNPDSWNQIPDAFISILKDRYPRLLDNNFTPKDIKAFIDPNIEDYLTEMALNNILSHYPFLSEIGDKELILRIIKEDIKNKKIAAIKDDMLIGVASYKLAEEAGKGKLAEMKRIPQSIIEEAINSPEAEGKNLKSLIKFLNNTANYKGIINISEESGKEGAFIEIKVLKGITKKQAKKELNSDLFGKFTDRFNPQGLPLNVTAETKNMRLIVWSAILGAKVIGELVKDKVFLAESENEYSIVIPENVTLKQLKENRDELIKAIRRHITVDRQNETISGDKKISGYIEARVIEEALGDKIIDYIEGLINSEEELSEAVLKIQIIKDNKRYEIPVSIKWKGKRVLFINYPDFKTDDFYLLDRLFTTDIPQITGTDSFEDISTGDSILDDYLMQRQKYIPAEKNWRSLAELAINNISNYQWVKMNKTRGVIANRMGLPDDDISITDLMKTAVRKGVMAYSSADAVNGKGFVSFAYSTKTGNGRDKYVYIKFRINNNNSLLLLMAVNSKEELFARLLWDAMGFPGKSLSENSAVNTFIEYMKNMDLYFSPIEKRCIAIDRKFPGRAYLIEKGNFVGRTNVSLEELKNNYIKVRHIGNGFILGDIPVSALLNIVPVLVEYKGRIGRQGEILMEGENGQVNTSGGREHAGMIPLISYIFKKFGIPLSYQALFEQIVFWAINLFLHLLNSAVNPILITGILWLSFVLIHYIRMANMPQAPPIKGILGIALVNAVLWLLIWPINLSFVEFILSPVFYFSFFASTLFHHYLNFAYLISKRMINTDDLRVYIRNGTFQTAFRIADRFIGLFRGEKDFAEDLNEGLEKAVGLIQEYSDDLSKGIIVRITGVPGSGKTLLARTISEKLGKDKVDAYIEDAHFTYTRNPSKWDGRKILLVEGVNSLNRLRRISKLTGRELTPDIEITILADKRTAIERIMRRNNVFLGFARNIYKDGIRVLKAIGSRNGNEGRDLIILNSFSTGFIQQGERNLQRFNMPLPHFGYSGNEVDKQFLMAQKAVKENNIKKAVVYVRKAINLLIDTDIDRLDNSGFPVADMVNQTKIAIWVLKRIKEEWKTDFYILLFLRLLKQGINGLELKEKLRSGKEILGKNKKGKETLCSFVFNNFKEPLPVAFPMMSGDNSRPGFGYMVIRGKKIWWNKALMKIPPNTPLLAEPYEEDGIWHLKIYIRKNMYTMEQAESTPKYVIDLQKERNRLFNLRRRPTKAERENEDKKKILCKFISNNFTDALPRAFSLKSDANSLIVFGTVTIDGVKVPWTKRIRSIAPKSFLWVKPREESGKWSLDIYTMKGPDTLKRKVEEGSPEYTIDLKKEWDKLSKNTRKPIEVKREQRKRKKALCEFISKNFEGNCPESFETTLDKNSYCHFGTVHIKGEAVPWHKRMTKIEPYTAVLVESYEEGGKWYLRILAKKDNGINYMPTIYTKIDLEYERNRLVSLANGKNDIERLEKEGRKKLSDFIFNNFIGDSPIPFPAIVTKNSSISLGSVKLEGRTLRWQKGLGKKWAYTPILIEPYKKGNKWYLRISPRKNKDTMQKAGYVICDGINLEDERKRLFVRMQEETEIKQAEKEGKQLLCDFISNNFTGALPKLFPAVSGKNSMLDFGRVTIMGKRPRWQKYIGSIPAGSPVLIEPYKSADNKWYLMVYIRKNKETMDKIDPPLYDINLWDEYKNLARKGIKNLDIPASINVFGRKIETIDIVLGNKETIKFLIQKLRADDIQDMKESAKDLKYLRDPTAVEKLSMILPIQDWSFNPNHPAVQRKLIVLDLLEEIGVSTPAIRRSILSLMAYPIKDVRDKAISVLRNLQAKEKLPVNLAVATPGMYTEEQHRKTNEKIAQDIKNGSAIAVRGSDLSENQALSPEHARLAKIKQNLASAEAQKALEQVTIFLLPPDNPDYPYFLRTEIINGNLEYQAAHAGTNKGRELNIYMTRQAFMELPLQLVKRILIREVKLAKERFAERYLRAIADSAVEIYNPDNLAQCVKASRWIASRLDELGIKYKKVRINIPFDCSKPAKMGEPTTSHSILEALYEGKIWVIDTQLLQFTLPTPTKLTLPDGFGSRYVYPAEEYYKTVPAYADSVCGERINKPFSQIPIRNKTISNKEDIHSREYLNSILGDIEREHIKARDNFERISIPIRLLWHGGVKFNFSNLLIVPLGYLELAVQECKEPKRKKYLGELFKRVQDFSDRLEKLHKYSLSNNTNPENMRRQMDVLISGMEIFDKIASTLNLNKTIGSAAEDIDFLLNLMKNFYTKKYQKRDIPLKELIALSIQNLHPSFREWIEKNIEIDIPETISVKCDPLITAFAIAQIFGNVYQMRETADISKIRISAAANGDKIKLIIENNGIGFSEDMQSIHPIYKKQNAFVLGISGREGGTGLGLAFLWNVLNDQGMGIHISNNSSLRAGRARFEITIPAGLPEPVSVMALGGLKSPVTEPDLYEVQKQEIYGLLDMITVDSGDRLLLKICIDAAFEKIRIDKPLNLSLKDIISGYIYAQIKEENEKLAEQYREMLLTMLAKVIITAKKEIRRMQAIFEGPSIQEDIQRHKQVPVRNLKYKIVGDFGNKLSRILKIEKGEVKVHRDFFYNIGRIAEKNNIWINLKFRDGIVRTSLLDSLYYGLALHEIGGHMQAGGSINPDEENALMSTGRRYLSVNLAVLFWYFNFFSRGKTDYTDSKVREIMGKFMSPALNPQLSWLKNSPGITEIVCRLNTAWQEGAEEINIFVDYKAPKGMGKVKFAKKAYIKTQFRKYGLPLTLRFDSLLRLAQAYSKLTNEQDLPLAELLLNRAGTIKPESEEFKKAMQYYKKQRRYLYNYHKALDCLREGDAEKAGEIYDTSIYDKNKEGINPLVAEILAVDNFLRQDSIEKQLRLVEEELIKVKKHSEAMMLIPYPHPYSLIDRIGGYLIVLKQRLKKEEAWNLYGKRFDILKQEYDKLQEEGFTLYRERAIQAENLLKKGSIGEARYAAGNIGNFSLRQGIITKIHIKQIIQNEQRKQNPLHNAQAFINENLSNEQGNPLWRFQEWTKAELEKSILPKVTVVINTEGKGVFNDEFKNRLISEFDLTGEEADTVMAGIKGIFSRRRKEYLAGLYIPQRNITFYIVPQSPSVAGDCVENGIGYINLKAIKELVKGIKDRNAQIKFLSIYLGVFISHEALGHEIGIQDEYKLTQQDAELFLKAGEQEIQAQTAFNAIYQLLLRVFKSDSVFVKDISFYGVYLELCKNLNKIYPELETPELRVLWGLVNNGAASKDYINLVYAMRADGVIDDKDFKIITGIAEAVEQADSNAVLTVSGQAVLVEALSMKYLIKSGGLSRKFKGYLQDRLNKLGYTKKVDRIIALLSGLKKNAKFNRRSYFDFVKKLGELLGEKDIFEELGLKSKVNFKNFMGNGDESITRQWADIFELNCKQWDVLELLQGKNPEGVIVQDIRDFGPGVQNWIEGIKRYDINMRSVKMAYIIDDKISEKDRKKIAASKPDNVVLASNLEELSIRFKNIVYLAERKELEPYRNKGIKLIERGWAGPVIELSWSLLMLTARGESEIKTLYAEFLKKLEALGLIEKTQAQKIADPYYIKLPKIENVLKMWDNLQQDTSSLDFWA